MDLATEQKVQEEEYDYPYHYLDQKSEMHSLFYYEQYKHTLSIVKEKISPFNKEIILDAGCGDGRFCFELKKLNANIVGIDYSEKALAFAKLINPDVPFYKKALDSECIDFEIKCDKIVCINVIEHIQPEKLHNVLLNLKRLLNVDGKIVFTVPSTKIKVPEKHYQHFSTDSIRELLKDYFEILSVEEYFKTDSSTYSFLKEIKLLLFPITKTSLRPFRYLRTAVKRFFTFIDKYYEKNVKSCAVDEGELLVVVAKKTNDYNF